jgi:hypothetical protein
MKKLTTNIGSLIQRLSPMVKKEPAALTTQPSRQFPAARHSTKEAVFVGIRRRGPEDIIWK